MVTVVSSDGCVHMYNTDTKSVVWITRVKVEIVHSVNYA